MSWLFWLPLWAALCTLFVVLIVLFSDTIGASLLCMALGEEIVVLCWLKRSSSEHHGTSIIFVHFLSFYDTLQSFPALKRFSWPNRTLIWAVFKTMSSLYNGWFRTGFPLIFPNWSWLEESPIKHHSYSCVFDVLCLMVNQLTSHGITMESPYHKWW